MLNDLFPEAYNRYLTLPLLGPICDDFACWLLQQGYQRRVVRGYFHRVVWLDRDLRQRGRHRLCELTHHDFTACQPANYQANRTWAAAIRAMERYLNEQHLMVPLQPPPPTRVTAQLTAYEAFLRDLRGLARSTIHSHIATAALFLEHLRYETESQALETLTASVLEGFVKGRGRQISRASLQHEIGHLRSFLRFLAAQGVLRPGLETQIDTPRLYRQEGLPRTLPWETVEAFLHSIDRTSARGRRDYALFFLMAHYGLRSCDLVMLTLDDLHWRQETIQLRQRKTGYPLVLPMTAAAGNVLVGYLQQGRLPSSHRQLFLQVRAPYRPMTVTAVTETFHRWSTQSDLAIPHYGPHCLRHAYANRLLRQGVGLKTIGDLLGHRSAESTCDYLRLAFDELREVALPVPPAAVAGKEDGS